MNSVRNAADGTYTEYDYSGGGTSTPVDEYQYGYDQFGNVAWKENVVAHGQGAGLDELFTYDSVGQLTSATWGQLNGAHNALTAGSKNYGFGENWTVDPLGNWTDYQQNDGNGNVNLDQSRTSDPNNFITGLGGGAVTPTYDAAGEFRGHST